MNAAWIPLGAQKCDSGEIEAACGGNEGDSCWLWHWRRGPGGAADSGVGCSQEEIKPEAQKRPSMISHKSQIWSLSPSALFKQRTLGR